MLAGLLCREAKLGPHEAAETDGGDKPTPAGWCYDPGLANPACCLQLQPGAGVERDRSHV